MYLLAWAAAPGGGERGTGPPQTFKSLTLCLWAVHGKNRLQMVLVPPPPPQSSRRGAALDKEVLQAKPVSKVNQQLFIMFQSLITHLVPSFPSVTTLPASLISITATGGIFRADLQTSAAKSTQRSAWAQIGRY